MNSERTSTTLYTLLSDRVNKNTYFPNEWTQFDVAAVWPIWLQETYYNLKLPNSQSEAIATSLRHPIHLHTSSIKWWWLGMLMINRH